MKPLEEKLQKAKAELEESVQELQTLKLISRPGRATKAMIEMHKQNIIRLREYIAQHTIFYDKE